MVTYNEPFIKLTFGGQLAAGQDEWNCGINLSISNDAILPITGTDALEAFEGYGDAINDDVIQDFTNYIEHNDMDVPQGATLDYIKIALIGEDGFYMTGPRIWEVVDVTGGRANAYIPQVSLVMTLQSDKFRDPGKYSRFYLPTCVPSGNNQYRPTKTADKANITAALLYTLDKDVVTLARTQRVRPAAVTSSDKFDGNYRPIRFVKVGNVFDTQRRRRNKIGETYATTEIVTPEPAPTP